MSTKMPLTVPHLLWAWGVDATGVTHILIPGIVSKLIYMPWCESHDPKTHLEFLFNPTMPTCLWCFVNVKR